MFNKERSIEEIQMDNLNGFASQYLYDIPHLRLAHYSEDLIEPEDIVAKRYKKELGKIKNKEYPKGSRLKIGQVRVVDGNILHYFIVVDLMDGAICLPLSKYNFPSNAYEVAFKLKGYKREPSVVLQAWNPRRLMFNLINRHTYPLGTLSDPERKFVNRVFRYYWPENPRGDGFRCTWRTQTGPWNIPQRHMDTVSDYKDHVKKLWWGLETKHTGPY